MVAEEGRGTYVVAAERVVGVARDGHGESVYTFRVTQLGVLC